MAGVTAGVGSAAVSVFTSRTSFLFIAMALLYAAKIGAENVSWPGSGRYIIVFDNGNYVLYVDSLPFAALALSRGATPDDMMELLESADKDVVDAVNRMRLPECGEAKPEHVGICEEVRRVLLELKALTDLI